MLHFTVQWNVSKLISVVLSALNTLTDITGISSPLAFQEPGFSVRVSRLVIGFLVDMVSREPLFTVGYPRLILGTWLIIPDGR